MAARKKKLPPPAPVAPVRKPFCVLDQSSESIVSQHATAAEAWEAAWARDDHGAGVYTAEEDEDGNDTWESVAEPRRNPGRRARRRARRARAPNPGGHKWVPYLVDGRPSATVKRATEEASGAYAIRRKDSGGVVYVGESNLGHMWRTLARHFQAPVTFTATKKPGGANAFATDAPGDYEVTWQITSRGKRKKGHGDQRAMALQARWIAKFRKAGNRLHNRDDGMANAEAVRDFRATRAAQAAEEAERPWYENPAAPVLTPQGELIELGRLTHLSFIVGDRLIELQWTLGAAPVLAFDGVGKLHIVYVGAVQRPSTPAEVRAYRKMHWGLDGVGKVRGGGVSVPPFRLLGEGFAITYTTRKGGDRKLVDYRHRWGEGKMRGFVAPQIVEHMCRGGCAKGCAARGSIALAGGSYVVSERGIVG